MLFARLVALLSRPVDQGQSFDEAGPGAHGLTAAYREALPTGQLLLGGLMTSAKRGLYAHLKETSGEAQFFLCLFPHSRPGSVLGGYLCGTTIIGPEPQPSLTRILMSACAIRRPRDGADICRTTGRSPGIWHRLACPSSTPESVDRQLAQFLVGDSKDGGASQIPPAEFRAILDVFDRHWLRHSG